MFEIPSLRMKERCLSLGISKDSGLLNIDGISVVMIIKKPIIILENFIDNSFFISIENGV